MQLNIAGHHVEVTDGIRENIQLRYAKIESHYPDLESISIILTVEKNEQKVEANTNYLGTTIAVHASHNDMYVAIADSVKKLDSALSHRKGVVKGNKHGQSARA